MNLLERLRAAFAVATPPGADPASFTAAVRPSNDPRFGDYQANGCMALAKAAGRNPRELAGEVAARLDLGALAPAPEIAGPGFLNVRLHDAFLESACAGLLNDPGLGVEPLARPRTVVVDFSSPNVAKPMHVGHVRSTVIGDSLSRILAAQGHRVIRDNHLGDWGTQFGMILWGWKTAGDAEAFAADPVGELARLYRLANARIKEGDGAVEEAARLETAKLHAGDPENRRLWQEFMPHCLKALAAIYHRLGVAFDVELGESFYDPMLAGVVDDLAAAGLATTSENATVVFVEGFKIPFLIRKSDGAYNYATTDLATIRYRAATWNPDQVLYVVDHRQADHFKLLFAVARKWGYTGIDFQHVAFGTILSRVTDPETGKVRTTPFKTRDGDAVGLESLLDEAVMQAREVVDANSPDLDPEERRAVAEIVGLGAIKYADLSQNRTSDYVFDWGKMMALTGNTATYMQYAYARIQSIFRKAETTPEAIREAAPAIHLGHPAERALALAVLRLPEGINAAAADFKPNALTDYLFDLANQYSAFYEACPVLKAESTAVRESRLALCDLTARTLARGLELLGIRTVERM